MFFIEHGQIELILPKYGCTYDNTISHVAHVATCAMCAMCAATCASKIVINVYNQFESLNSRFINTQRFEVLASKTRTTISAGILALQKLEFIADNRDSQRPHNVAMRYPFFSVTTFLEVDCSLEK